ncbi:uncharacterized protein Dmoj_GI26279 [Drosophila mojavensis]|uniref:Uncharacterized protein n=1 Tax=Drosophila mojavensis TaxID=7230 RepID=A0A0Q9XL41_DROMO|nr:uncharacterized protein Dmoj_GI26279 [Drosophila mojavensis]
MDGLFGCRFKTAFNLFNPQRCLSFQCVRSKSAKYYEKIPKEYSSPKLLKMQYDALMDLRRQKMAERRQLDYKILDLQDKIDEIRDLIRY